MGRRSRTVSDVTTSYIDIRMILGARLAQPIEGGVSTDGRLIFADDALRQLHRRAGGTEGGAFAIPGLANLAALTHRLKMRLSRAVRVADENDDLELWVEAVSEGDVAKLSILSWRSLAPKAVAWEDISRRQELALAHEDSVILFDTALRLISAKGPVIGQLETTDFGRAAKDVLRKILGDSPNIEGLYRAIAEKREFASIFSEDMARPTSVSGAPQFSAEGLFAGYRCDLAGVENAVTVEPVLASPGALFVRQLAPVLRQPLGRIIANAETIGSGLNGPIRENYALYAKDIANAARHLVELVDDLGDLEAVERTDFMTAKDNIELGDVARRVAGLLALKAADHSIRIVTPPASHKVAATAEFRRVLQILLNLVTNAIRYSPDGTEVNIDIEPSDDAALLIVSDQGSGILADDRERAFDKFERLGRSGDGGSGLGLYISRRLARAMGGDLTIGTATGGGAKFTLRLPIS